MQKNHFSSNSHLQDSASIQEKTTHKCKSALMLLLLLLLFAACAMVLNRYQIANGFEVLPGDRYDFVIVATILEHWFNVISGNATWSDVLYFYPYGRTIAQTDAYFLVGVAYSPFRALGLDPFISVELAGNVVKAIGFFSMFYLSRRIMGLSFLWSSVAAILFTLSNGMTIHSQRLQLATVAFSPLMASLLWHTLDAFIQGNIAHFRRYGIAAGVFFGAWCLSCFYMAWFFCFYISALLFWLAIGANADAFRHVRVRITQYYGSVLLVFTSAVISLIPFVWAFLPKSREVGVRAYETVLANTVPIEGVLQTGKDNLLYGRLYAEILSYVSPDYVPAGEYYNTGFTFLLFALFVMGVVEAIRSWRTNKSGLLVFSLALATISTWVLTLNIHGKSAWFFVYQLFPGAKALNVVSAYQIFLAFPVTLIAIVFLSRKVISHRIIGLIVFSLIISELNRPYLNFHYDEEIERITLKDRPPGECKVFYVSGWAHQSDIAGFAEWVNNYYAHNVSAMLIAQLTRIPTINGIASFNPPDWNFGYPNNGNYDERIHEYARVKNISNLCRYNLNTKEWTIIEDRPAVSGATREPQ